MILTWSRIPLKLARTFKTATARRTDKETLCVRIVHEGIVGWGEAAPVDTYQQTLEGAEATLAAVAASLRGDPLNVERIVDGLLRRFDDQRATVSAIDAALHDWIGKRFGIATTRWLGLDPTDIPLTSFTIGIDELETIAEKVREADAYPILKIKLGTARDEEVLSTIREIAPEKVLRADANTAWSVEEALDRLSILAAWGVEFVEQPIPPGDNAGLRRLKEAAVCPIVADESCVRPADVVALAGCVDGVNIKLSKCGGIREALKMIRLARALGMKVMLGCMVESSLGIAAAAQLAPLADWLDLDGHLLLSEDPFTGIGGAGGRLCVGLRPGLGVRRV
ncbi:MAG: dipeptide epimerase [Phycisphaerae bacterium]|nr:dipeptide epimerase [Phycisphaerae bacterium]